MSQELLEQHEDLVMDIARMYMENMELELGKKYRKNRYEMDASMNETQHTILKNRYKISDKIYSDLYSAFQTMEPTEHLQNAMNAFSASGGSVDIEPNYDENTGTMSVAVNFSIKDKTLDRIEGLTPLEDVMLRLNAMVQVGELLSENDSSADASF